jgi:hypothetical protein
MNLLDPWKSLILIVKNNSLFRKRHIFLVLYDIVGQNMVLITIWLVLSAIMYLLGIEWMNLVIPALVLSSLAHVAARAWLYSKFTARRAIYLPWFNRWIFV